MNKLKQTTKQFGQSNVSESEDNSILSRLSASIYHMNCEQIGNIVNGMKNGRNIIVAYWLIHSSRCQLLDNYLLVENVKARPYLQKFTQSSNENLLAISSYLICFSEKNNHFTNAIDTYIMHQNLNYLTDPQIEYLIEDILQPEVYSRLYQLNSFKLKIEDNPGEISFPCLMIKYFMQKILYTSNIYDQRPSTSVRLLPSKNASRAQSNNLLKKRDITPRPPRLTNISLKPMIIEEESNNDESGANIGIIARKRETSSSQDLKSIQLNIFYYEKLEKIISPTVVQKEENMNNAFLKILSDDEDFSQLLGFFKKQQLELIVLPVQKNFIQFYQSELYNIAMFIVDRLDSQNLQMLSNDEVHELIIKSFKDEFAVYVDFEIKLFVMKCFINWLSLESCKQFVKVIDEILVHNVQQFLVNSSNPLIRIILTVEILEIISQRFYQLKDVKSKIVQLLAECFNGIIDNSDSYEILKSNLLEKDFEERCIFDVILQHNMLEFLTSETVKNIINEEWDENMTNVQSTNLIDSNQFLFRSIKNQFWVSNSKLIPLFQDAIAYSRDNSQEKVFYYQFSKWKGNILHKFMFESCGYLMYFILILIYYMRNLTSYSVISLELLRFSNNKTYYVGDMHNITEFISHSNTFVINTRQLNVIIAGLLGLTGQYLNKIVFSLKTGCKLSRIISDSFFVDALVVALILLNILYYNLFDIDHKCILEKAFLFSYNISDHTYIPFANYSSGFNLSNDDDKSQLFCQYLTIEMNTTNEFYFNLAYELKEDFFLILNHIFFAYRLTGIIASAFLMKLLFYFKLNSIMGPFIEIIRIIILNFFSFFLLMLIIIFIGTVFVNFCFFDINPIFTNFWLSFVGLFEILIGARVGSDYFQPKTDIYSKLFGYETISNMGRLFIFLFTLISTVLILNLTIAMISTNYNKHYRVSKAIYCKEILKFKNAHIFPNIYDSLLRFSFPLDILLLPFLLPFLCIKNITVIKCINKTLNVFYYIPYLFVYLLLFLVTNVCYYLINVISLLGLIAFSTFKCRISFEILLFSIYYFIFGIYFVFSNAFTFLRICAVKHSSQNISIEQLIKPRLNNQPNLQKKKSILIEDKATRKTYKLYSSSFQRNGKTDMNNGYVLMIDDIFFLHNMLQKYKKEQVLLNKLMTEVSIRYPKLNKAEIFGRKSVKSSLSEMKSNSYVTFQDILSSFDFNKDGNINIVAVFGATKCTLDNFLFRKIIREFNNREYLNEFPVLGSQSEQNSNFILLQEKYIGLQMSYIGRNVINLSVGYEQDPMPSVCGIKSHKLKEETNEDVSSNSSNVSESDQEVNFTKYFKKGKSKFVCSRIQSSKTLHIDEIQERVEGLEKRIGKIETAVYQILENVQNDSHHIV